LQPIKVDCWILDGTVEEDLLSNEVNAPE
jgi:hypothetical protein